MWHRAIDVSDPVEAAERLAGQPGLAFLDSAMTAPGLGRYSYVAADPFGRFTVRGGRAFWNGQALPEAPLAALRALLARFRMEPVPGLPPFQGGAIGVLDYEFGRCLDDFSIPVAAGPGDDAVVTLGFHDVVIAFDHAEGRAVMMASGFPETDPAARAARAMARMDQMAGWLARPAMSRNGNPPVTGWRSSFTPTGYEAAVERVRGYILDGDIYQANIAQHFRAALPDRFDPWCFYAALRAANPATFSAYLALEDRVIASSSPERFVTLRGRHIETRPIKGTARRGADPASDAAAAAALLASDKDRAENVMIVDLLRNDLSRVAVPGTVAVPALCALESYASVHHLVSVVTAELAEGSDGLDLVASAFPGGSITGAPKLRAMEIIAEIEQAPRGAYCGAIGYFGFDGSLDLNIAIRTVTLRDGEALVQAGGGITLLSDPEAEYAETLLKAQRIFEAFAQGSTCASARKAS